MIYTQHTSNTKTGSESESSPGLACTYTRTMSVGKKMWAGKNTYINIQNRLSEVSSAVDVYWKLSSESESSPELACTYTRTMSVKKKTGEKNTYINIKSQLSTVSSASIVYGKLISESESPLGIACTYTRIMSVAKKYDKGKTRTWISKVGYQ